MKATAKVTQLQPKNQAGHLTLMSNDELKKCEICGDYLEFMRPPLVINGVEKEPAKKMKQICYCQAQELKKKEANEKKARERAQLFNKYKVAEIPPRFLDWNFDKVTNSDQKEVCQRYVDCFDINLAAGIGLFMVGDKGRGKTTLTVCMQKELIRNGYTSMIVSFREILSRMLSTYKDASKQTQRQIMNDLLKFDFIVFDDFGREAYTEKQLELAFWIIDELNKHKKCIAITANPEMINKLKTPKTKENPNGFKYANEFIAILDRLSEMCKIELEFKGKSFRNNQEVKK